MTENSTEKVIEKDEEKGTLAEKKPKKNKITKNIIEERFIATYENDVDVMFADFNNLGLDVTSQKCKKCNFETHSEGHLRQHKVSNDDTKETKQNIILG